MSVAPFRKLLSTFKGSNPKEPLSEEAPFSGGVQIIKSLSDLQNELEQKPKESASEQPESYGGFSSLRLKRAQSNSLSLEDIRVWNKKALGGLEAPNFLAGPNKCTTNVAWLVGHSGESSQHHIDIYENSQPPSHLNVKETDGGEGDNCAVSENSNSNNNNNSLRYNYSLTRSKNIYNVDDVKSEYGGSEQNFRGHYSLARSKSVCDIGVMISGAENVKINNGSGSSVSGNNNKESGGSGSGSAKHKRSRVVRNRTILGSFPLFYKLSQSLSSLNTTATTSATSATSTTEDELSSVSSMLLPMRSAAAAADSGTIGRKCKTFKLDHFSDR